MDIYKIFCLILIGICALLVIVFCFINSKYSKLLKSLNQREVDDIQVKHKTRYTVDQTVVDEQGNMNISYSSKDILIAQKKTESVGIKNKVKPGKYNILSTTGEEDSFNIRLNGYVKEYKHNQKIVLAEGDEITPVNNSIILR